MTNREPSSTAEHEVDLATIATDEGLHFVTSNETKYLIASDVFSPELTLEQTSLDLQEIQSTSPHTVAKHKADAAFKRVGAPVLVDDFSFFIDGLNKFPGTLVKHLLNETGMRGLRGLYQVTDAGCTFRCTAAVYDGEKYAVSAGKLRGTLRLQSDNSDRSSRMLLSTVFVPAGYDDPLSELQIETHRHKAYAKLKDRLTYSP